MKRVLEIGPAIGAATGALGSAAASICCLGPVGIALLGVNGAIFAAALKPYRTWLLVISLALIGVGFWVFRRSPRSSSAACDTRAGRVTRFVLWGSAAAWVVAVIAQFAYEVYIR